MDKCLDIVYELFVVENNQVIYIPVTKIKCPSKSPVATSNQTFENSFWYELRNRSASNEAQFIFIGNPIT